MIIIGGDLNDELYNGMFDIYIKRSGTISNKAVNDRTDKIQIMFTAKPWWNGDLTEKWQLSVQVEI